VALWREALLAGAVLAGRTKGYRHHPQLERFRGSPDPLAALDAYLFHVRQEGLRRGYRFRAHDPAPGASALTVTKGQLAYELEHLRRKLAARAPDWARRLPDGLPEPHPLFRVVEGEMEPWERP
jgi:hypothetical protein